MKISKIKLMPKYLKDYVTEFNFLFHQIYLCANADTEDETQHGLFYNFGNNTRKFLEAFLFYKYPNALDRDDKLTRFFGDNRQASSMTDRINNEFSHLEGLFERSMIPIDIPEMKKTATFILDKIKEKDNDQYEALLISIGVEISETNSSVVHREPVIDNENLKALLKILTGNKSCLEIKNLLGIKNHKTFVNNFLFPALSNGLIMETYRKKKKKQYCLTLSGTELKAQLKL